MEGDLSSIKDRGDAALVVQAHSPLDVALRVPADAGESVRTELRDADQFPSHRAKLTPDLGDAAHSLAIALHADLIAGSRRPGGQNRVLPTEAQHLCQRGGAPRHTPVVAPVVERQRGGEDAGVRQLAAEAMGVGASAGDAGARQVVERRVAPVRVAREAQASVPPRVRGDQHHVGDRRGDSRGSLAGAVCGGERALTGLSGLRVSACDRSRWQPP